VITGLAHAAVCVPDAQQAVDWYTSVLGLRVISPPYLMEGDEIRADMEELVPGVAVRAAIVGFDRTDHVIEIIEYPNHTSRPRPPDADITDVGISHLGLLCDDIVATRADLEAHGVVFLVSGVAEIAGLRTTWFRDPFGVVFILLEKSKQQKPYYRQL